MSETDKYLIFSESVKAGKRIYYFDVKQSRNGDKYIAITESKKINEGTMEEPRFVIEKHKLFLYKEDYDKFVEAMSRALDVAKGNISAEEASKSVANAQEEPLVNSGHAAPEQPAPKAAPAEEKPEEKAEKKSFLDKVKDIF